MTKTLLCRLAAPTAIALLLAACGGGSDSAGDRNSAPTANAGANQSVDEFSTVSLNGTGSDANPGDTLSFSWTQMAGPTVVLAGADTASASFTAPDVFAGNPQTLTFRLTVSDGSLNGSDTVDVTVNDIGLGANNPPTANAGSDRTVLENTTITLTGSGADPDGGPVTFAWVQTAGPAVTLSDPNVAQPTFTSPNVAAGSPAVLTFELTVDDGTDSTTDAVNITVAEGLSFVDVSGRLTYEFPPPLTNCRDLNFNAIQLRPVRGATVQLIDAADGVTVLDESQTDAAGNYLFANIPATTDVRVRIRAELKRAGSPGWDVEVRDNTATGGIPGQPIPLGQRALYVVQFASFNTGIDHVTGADFTARTGWGGTSYTGVRAAAPLAILDQIYTGIQAVLAENPTEVFSPLDAFWSINNTLTGTNNIDNGELSSSFYRSDIDSLFLLGNASVDTEEFDDHVTMHEWGHYFEDNFSRSDSIGGAHFIGESLDPRVAFGEGWATALAAIVLENPLYCDTRVVGGNNGFRLNTESENGGVQGWFNEMSVATLIYDLWDTVADGVDTGSIGLGPILDTMMGPQIHTDAFTTLFSFAAELRPSLGAADANLLDDLLFAENIDTPGLAIFGEGQSTLPPGLANAGRDVLPVHAEMTTDGAVNRICTNADYKFEQDQNKLAERRFLRFTPPASGSWTIRVQANPVPPPTADTTPAVRDRSDPDLYLFRRGQFVGQSISGADDVEIFNTPSLVANATYVVDLQEWRYADADAASDFPDQVCYDVTISQ